MASIKVNRTDLRKLQKKFLILSEFDHAATDKIVESRVSKIVENIVDVVPFDTGKLSDGVDSYKEAGGTVIEAIAISESEDYGAALEVSGYTARTAGRKIPFFWGNIEKGGEKLIDDLKKAIKKATK